MSLRYQVKGSGAKPYQITVEGAGANLRAFCSCPAMRMGGMFCKHVAALLMGEVTNLVQPSDDVEELKRRAVGSPLVGKAVKHVPYAEKRSPPPIGPGVKTVEDVADLVEPLLANADLLGEYSAGDDGSESLDIFGKFKNGKPRKTPILTLSFEPMTYDLQAGDHGELIEINHRPRVRPWGLRTKEKANAWGTLERAGGVFMEELQKVISSQ